MSSRSVPKSPPLALVLLVLGFSAVLVVLVVVLTTCNFNSDAKGAASGACGTEGGNVFANGGFEEGEEPWHSKDTPNWGEPFSVSDAQTHGGEGAALLNLRADPELDILVVGVVQDVAPEKFPEIVSGYYYVENWEKSTDIQYLQFAIIVDQATNQPEIASNNATPITNHQMRFFLTSNTPDDLTVQISNAKYVVIDSEEPATGRWVYFERNLCDDFQTNWGDVPEGFAKLSFFFEARYEARPADSGPTSADVYYDDLYLGPAAGNPNRPEDATDRPSPTP
jgi:hypothetical protein